MNVSDAAFLLQSTGVRYNNGLARFEMNPDIVVVEQFRIEDDKGDGTQADWCCWNASTPARQGGSPASASRFELLQNELGDIDVDAVLTVSGSLTAPVINRDVVLYRAAVRVATGLIDMLPES